MNRGRVVPADPGVGHGAGHADTQALLHCHRFRHLQFVPQILPKGPWRQGTQRLSCNTSPHPGAGPWPLAQDPWPLAHSPAHSRGRSSRSISRVPGAGPVPGLSGFWASLSSLEGSSNRKLLEQMGVGTIHRRGTPGATNVLEEPLLWTSPFVEESKQGRERMQGHLGPFSGAGWSQEWALGDCWSEDSR